MKIVKSQLRRLIQEELRALLQEQLPPSDEEVASAFGHSLSTGLSDDGEWVSVDRLDEPEYAAMQHVVDQIKDSAALTALMDEMLEEEGVLKVLRVDPSQVSILRPKLEHYLDKVVTHLLEEIDIETIITKGIDGQLPTWKEFNGFIRKTVEHMPLDSHKRVDRVAQVALRLLLGELMTRTGGLGTAADNQYGVDDWNRKMKGFQDIAEGRKGRK